MLDATARLVLGALCRSSLLRLRSDAFSSVLDDLPLARSTQVWRQGQLCLVGLAACNRTRDERLTMGAAQP